MKTLMYKILLIVLISFLSYSAMAQPGPGGERALERIETMRKIKLLEILKLDEAASDKFISKFTTYENNIKEKRDQIDDLSEELANTLRSHGSKEEITKKSEKLLQLQEELQKLFMDKLKAMRSILNEEQYAKFLIFENNFPKELRKQLFKYFKNKGSDRDDR
ncbi:MAG: hypothetical protein HW421_2573 [Ignavibacteria bacterium]|nr:hypothetical protein [Ignavibacteria bacterium]